MLLQLQWVTTGLQQDETKAIELWIRAAEFGCSKVHNDLGMHYYHGGTWKKAKFHLEAAAMAMAGHEGARNNIGHLEFLQFNNTDRAIKHWIIAASAGSYLAMNAMRSCFENGIDIDREYLNSTLTAYNTSCGECWEVTVPRRSPSMFQLWREFGDARRIPCPLLAFLCY